MKKINGFLVVRFNDREKRNNPTLGSFGVIDAEQYTGDIDYDLDAMEYTDADRIEIAVEQARGLDAEEDFGDEPTTYTVITEAAEKATEEKVEPKLLALSYEQELKTQVESDCCPDIDPRAAAHELNGYKTALVDLGLLDRDDAVVELNTFGDAYECFNDGRRADITPPSPAGPSFMSVHDDEEALAYVCDELCRFRDGRTQDELDAICEKCKLGSWVQVKLQEKAPPGREAETKRDTFIHAHPNIQRDRIIHKIYTLGLILAEYCPANDCKVYLNIFNMARDLDTALDKAEGYPALVLRGALHDRLRELSEMYLENYAIQKYKEGAQL